MPDRFAPLEEDWIERPLVLDVEGQPVTGRARANWCAVEVTITAPIAYLTHSHNARGFCFGFAAVHYPESRFVLRGELTDRGRREVHDMLARLYLDWLAVFRHQNEVDAQCRRLHQRLSDLDRALTARKQALLEEGRGLRQIFHSGGLSRQGYKQKMNDIGKQFNHLTSAGIRARHAFRDRFAGWMRRHSGRRMTVEWAEKLLLEIPIIVPA